MPQPGLHAIVALACRRRISTKPMFGTGLVIGSMVPDLDGYTQAVAVTAFRMPAEQAEAIFHRTLTHSLLFALAVGVIIQVVAAIKKSDTTKWFGWGLVVGLAVFHSVLDIFAWFAGVGILWPFASVNLWNSVHLGETMHNLLRAGNFLAFAGLLGYLHQLSENKSRAGRYALIQLAIGLIMTALAFILNTKMYGLIDGAVLLLWAFPNALVTTWKMRDTIEGSNVR